MFKQKLADDVSARIADVMAMSPAKDIEKNLKTALTGWLTKLDLVSREEFDVQTALLVRSQERLKTLETRLAELERSSTQAPQE